MNQNLFYVREFSERKIIEFFWYRHFLLAAGQGSYSGIAVSETFFFIGLQNWFLCFIVGTEKKL